MSFDAYAVSTRGGPHVTMQAGVVHLGRHWTTTTRRSVKAGAIRRTGHASATVTGPGGHRRLVAGPARVLDPTRPWTALGASAPEALAAAVDAALAGGALARMAGGQLAQVLGYLEAGRAVPGSWLPWGRVILVTDVVDDLDLGAPLPGGPRQAARPPDGWVADLPAVVAGVASQPGPCHVGVAALGGAAALPARWDPASGAALLARACLDAVGADLPGPVCTTLDESTSRRPDRKVGLIVRGWGAVEDAGAGTVAVRVAAERASWWDGFRSGSVAAAA